MPANRSSGRTILPPAPGSLSKVIALRSRIRYESLWTPLAGGRTQPESEYGGCVNSG